MANVLITGASRGIGFQMAQQYCENGDSVLASCRNPGGADALNELAASSGGKVTVVDMDVSDPKSIEAAAKTIGDQQIDIVINNAGATGGAHQSLGDIDFDDWMDTFNVNTIAPFRVSVAFHDNLKKSDAAKVMIVTSQLGASTWPMGGMYAYSTSKAAVSKVGQILAMDWKDDGISVCVVHPGWVRTDMGGPQAEISPEESASGIRSVIASMGLADSGKFYKWNGEIHPW